MEDLIKIVSGNTQVIMEIYAMMRGETMKKSLFDWTVHLQADLTAITDHYEKKMVILEPSIELNSIIWMDDNNELQIKPTWDCVISIDPTNKSLTIRQTKEVFGDVYE